MDGNYSFNDTHVVPAGYGWLTPLSEVIPWNEGSQRPWVWVILITLRIGVILNLITITTLFLDKERAVIGSREARTIVISMSCSFTLWALMVCSTSVVATILGGFPNALCKVQAFLILFLGTLNQLHVALLSVHVFRRVTTIDKKKLPLRFIFPAFILIGTAIAVLVGVFPGDSYLISSGAFCAARSNTIISYCVDVPFFVMTFSLLYYFYWHIYSYFKRISPPSSSSTCLNCSYNTLTPHDQRKLRLVIRFTSILLTMSLLYLPEIVLLLYEMISGYYAHPILSTIAGIAITSESIFTPIAYFWSNPSARALFLFKIGKGPKPKGTKRSSQAETLPAGSVTS